MKRMLSPRPLQAIVLGHAGVARERSSLSLMPQNIPHRVNVILIECHVYPYVSRVR